MKKPVQRDLDLHPDYVEPALQRAKRQLGERLEEPTAKLRRLRTTAEAKAYAAYEQAPSARELRCATRVAVREKAQALHGAAALVVQAANEELDILADEVAAARTTVAAAGCTVATAGTTLGVELASGIRAQGVATHQLVEAKVEAVKEQAVTAVKTTLWAAMNYLQPRVKTWSSLGDLGFRAAPAPPASAAHRAAKPAVATLVTDDPCEQVFAA